MHLRPSDIVVHMTDGSYHAIRPIRPAAHKVTIDYAIPEVGDVFLDTEAAALMLVFKAYRGKPTGPDLSEAVRTSNNADAADFTIAVAPWPTLPWIFQSAGFRSIPAAEFPAARGQSTRWN